MTKIIGDEIQDEKDTTVLINNGLKTTYHAQLPWIHVGYARNNFQFCLNIDCLDIKCVDNKLAINLAP